MDETCSALDPLIRIDMQTVLLDLQKEIRKTIAFIAHDLDQALQLFDVPWPADDYVESFVKGVYRGRVVRVEAAMRRGASDCARSQYAARGHARALVARESGVHTRLAMDASDRSASKAAPN